MTIHGQPSAPPFHGQNYRARWLQSPLTTDNVPPLFDYELYRESRRDPSFNKGVTATRTGAVIDQGCLGLSSIVNACYESPHDQHQSYSPNNHYSTQNAAYSPSPRVRAAVGPPAYIIGGGFDRNDQKAQRQNGDQKDIPAYSWNTWSFASQPAAEPHYSSRESEYVPWISLAIAIACTIIFIMIMQHNDCPSRPRKACLLPSLRRFAFQPFGENPLLGPSARTLMRMGALEADLITKAHEGWRLLSAMWLHAGVLHIMGTILGMLILGIPLERQLGFLKISIIYILSGFMGSTLSALMLHGRVSVGPSGAFMGVLGATLSSILVNWKSYPNRSRMLMAVVFFIALNTVYGLMPLIDNFMHLGGAVMGFLVGNLFFIRPNLRCWKSAVHDQEDMPVKRKNAIVLDIAWLLSLATLVVVTIMTLFALFSGMNISDSCSWCQYLTCAPSRFWKCSGNRNLGCNPSSFHGGLRVTCANGRFVDYTTVQYASKLTHEIEGLCVRACV